MKQFERVWITESNRVSCCLLQPLGLDRSSSTFTTVPPKMHPLFFKDYYSQGVITRIPEVEGAVRECRVRCRTRNLYTLSLSFVRSFFLLFLLLPVPSSSCSSSSSSSSCTPQPRFRSRDSPRPSSLRLKQ